MSTKHGLESYEDITDPPFRDLYGCPHCHYETKSVHSIKTHLTRHEVSCNVFQCYEELPEYICDKCRFNTNEVYSFNGHVCKQKIRTLIRKKIPFSVGVLNCDLCDFQTHSLLVLMKHVIDCNEIQTEEQMKMYYSNRHEFNKCYQFLTQMRYSTGQDIEWLKCDQCPFMAKLDGNVQKHISKTHGIYGLKWYECKLCFYNIEQIVKLRKHILKEHTEKVGECDECDDSDY